MKILIFSDLHLNNWRSFGISDDLIISKRLQDQVNILEQISSVISENRIELVIFGGDLFHKRGELPVECINIIDDWVNEIESKCKIIWVRGNHDLFNDVSYNQLHDSLNFLEKEHTKTVAFGGVRICTVGYHEDVDYEKLKDWDLVVLHKQPMLIDEYGHRFDGVNWKRLSDTNKLVFFGHYHKHMRFAANCFTIGSPLPLTFNDRDDRGVYVVDTDGVDSALTYEYDIIGNYAVAFVKLHSPKFITVEDESQVAKDNNYYRVLNASRRIDNSRVLSVIKPAYFEERIKSDDFHTILAEWLTMHNRPDATLDVVKEILTDKIDAAKQFFKGRLMNVQITDFLSVGEIAFDIENGFTLISGMNEDTNDSNGCGKSSIFEAVYWCLFGETTKGLTGDDVIRRGQRGCRVELRLDGDKCYLVSRSRKDGLVIEVDGSDITSGLRLVDRQKILEEQILGFDKGVYLTSCYFSQENLTMLTGLSDVDKTNMITNLLGFERYDDLYDGVAQKIKKTNVEIEGLYKSRDVLNSRIESVGSKIEVLTERVKTDKGRMNNLITQVEGYKIELAALNKATVDQYALRESELQKDMLGIEAEILEAYSDKSSIGAKVSGLQTKQNMTEDAIDGLVRQINNLNKLNPNEKCDRCGALITEGSVIAFVNEKNRAIEAKMAETTNISTQLVALEKARQRVEATLAGLEGKKAVCTQALKDVREKGNQAQVAISKYESWIEGHNKRIEEAQTDIGRDEGEIDECNDKIVGIRENISELDKKVERLNADIDTLEFWSKSFSPTGIRALLLDRFCNNFNKLVNERLSTISSGIMSMAVKPTKILKSGEERNRIDFAILLNDTEVKYQSLSGGEKRRVDTALCLTLNEWVSITYQLPHGLLGILILDELFSYLDDVGAEEIANVLFNEGLNKAVYVIDHATDLSSYATNVMRVVKRNGISELEDVKTSY